MIKVGVIGTGNIAPSHLEAYLAEPDRCRVVALADIVPEHYQRTAERFALADGSDQVACFDSHRRLLEEADVDLVSICTPPGTHAEIAIDALESGRHVVLEKPMAASLEQCDAVLAAEAASGRMLSVVAQNRFRTEMLRLKRLLEAGTIGQVLHAEVDSLWWRGNNYYDLWWRGTWESEGGGCTLNHAVHHVDLLLWLMGSPSEVRAMMGNVAHDHSEVEDLSVALMRFPNGSLGQLTASVVHHGQRQQLVFQGERAAVSVPFDCHADRAKENGFPERDEAVEAEVRAAYENEPALEREGHRGQIANVLAALEGSEELLIDGVQGRRTIELITAIYESAILGAPVQLPLSSEDPFYRQSGLLAAAPRYHHKSVSSAELGSESISTSAEY